MTKEKLYLVITCLKCGRPLLTESAVKIRRCPYCGARFHVEYAKVLARAKRVQDAKVILSNLKLEMAKRIG